MKKNVINFIPLDDSLSKKIEEYQAFVKSCEPDFSLLGIPKEMMGESIPALSKTFNDRLSYAYLKMKTAIGKNE